MSGELRSEELALREDHEGFETEREAYLLKLVGALKQGLWPLSLKMHSIDWPVDIRDTKAHIASYYGEINYSRPASGTHKGIDVQLKPGIEIQSPEDARVVFCGDYDSYLGLSNLNLYSEKTGLFYRLGHLDIESIPERIRKRTWFDRDSNTTVRAGENIGKVGIFSPKGLELEDTVDIPEDVQLVYGRKYDHLHIQIHYYPNKTDLVGMLDLKNEINPILLFKRLYRI